MAPGLIGNPTPFPQCTTAEFTTFPDEAGANLCPPDTAVGVATISFVLGDEEENDGDASTSTVPVFNLVPRAGEPARFAFFIETAPVYLEPSVRTGGDYGVTLDVNNITQIAELLASRVTFWGGCPAIPATTASAAGNAC